MTYSGQKINEVLSSEQLQRIGIDVREIPKQIEFMTTYEQFIKIPTWVIDLVSKGIISSSAFQLYAVIASFCYYNKSFTWASKAQLAKKTRLSVRTVYRLLNELVEAGVIYIHTTKINNIDKSVIFLLSKRNIQGPRYIKSKRHFFSNNKSTDTDDTTIMSPVSVGYCQGCHESTVTGVRRNTTNMKQRQPNTTNTENNTRGSCSRIGTRVFSKSSNIRSMGDKELLYKSLDFSKKYYRAINRKFGTRLRSRESDIANIFSLFMETGLEPGQLWEFIKKHLNDEHFLKTNKHLSVWTGPKYTQLLYDEFNLEENVDLLYPDFYEHESIFDIPTRSVSPL